MALWSSWFGGAPSAAPLPAVAEPTFEAPRAATQSLGGGVLITNAKELSDYLESGSQSKSGASVTPHTAMQVAAVYACVRIISGAVATLPLHIKRRIDDRTREDASDTPLWKLIRRKPNRWQKPAQFRRLMQTNILLRGNAYALIVRSRGEIRELIPLHPDRVKVKQLANLEIEYIYTRADGGQVTLLQSEVFHLYCMTLDGIVGVTPITFARETIGLSLSMEDHGSSTFKNGARFSTVLSHPAKLGQDGQKLLKASLDDYRAGGDNEGKALILEEGMKVEKLNMTAADTQWIESRKFSRSDIAMFFGVPPHMIGDTEKSTSWGSGIEQQSIGFVAYTLEDHLTVWEEGITADLSTDDDIYAKFNRNALVKGDIKARWEAYVKALQWGVYNPDKVLALEDENPREDGKGGQYYDPPNTAGGDKPKPDDKEPPDDDPNAA